MSGIKEKALTKKELLTLLKEDPGAYLNLSRAKKRDKDLALEAMLASLKLRTMTTYDGGYGESTYSDTNKISLEDIPLEIRGDKDFILKVFSERPDIISNNLGMANFVPKHLYDDKDVAMTIVNYYPIALRLTSDRLKDDFDVVENATEYYSENMIYASEKLKKDMKLQSVAIVSCVNRDLWRLSYIPKEIRNLELMSLVYDLDVKVLFKIMDYQKNSASPFESDCITYNQFSDLAQTVLRHPNKKEEFYVEKLLAYDKHCELVEKNKGISVPSGTKFEVMALEHLSDMLSLDCLRSLKGKSAIFQDIFKKREIKGISFKSDKASQKAKKTRKSIL